MWTDSENAITIYQNMLTMLAHIDFTLDKKAREELREKLKVEAARVQGDDSLALRLLANIVEIYMQAEG